MPQLLPLEDPQPESLIGSVTSLVLGVALLGRKALSDTLQGLDDRTATPVRAPNGSTFDAVALGLFFEGQRIALRSARQVARVGSAGLDATRSIVDAAGATNAGARTWTVVRPLTEPVQRSVNRLAKIGKEQEAKALSLAEAAFSGVTEVSIREVTVRAVEEVARSDKAREVLRAETMGAAEAAVDEVRGIAKEADSRLEHVARSIFRRPMRNPAPQPAGGPVS
jgi:hypothetical protein